MESNLPTSFLNKLSDEVKVALSGGARFVHPSAMATVWRFGELKHTESGCTLSIDDANHLPPFGELMIPIAMSDESDVLLVRDDAHLSCVLWFHDDSPIENTRLGLADWIRESSRIDVGKRANDKKEVLLPDSLVGRWKPTRIITPGHKGVLKTLPSIELSKEGVWIDHCTWPKKMKRECRVVSFDVAKRQFDVEDGEDLLPYWFSFKEDGELILAGPQRDFEVCYQRAD